MFHFCTYFDKHYLPRGLALYCSLEKHCPKFKLWVLCLDDTTYRILVGLQLPYLYPVSLEEFERDDEPLRIAKTNRSIVEYYFTCTPSLTLYILNKWPEVNLITYLDADLFFFASPDPLFEELGTGSVAIIGHRFSPNLKYLERHGIYNVGWLSFRRDISGLACLNWWRNRCIEWCYDRTENDKFADQKYLDKWPALFKDVVILQHKGANLAPWNVGNYDIRYINSTVWVNVQPLIFYHFQGFKPIKNWFFDTGLGSYQVTPTSALKKHIYLPYTRTLLNTAQLYPLMQGIRSRSIVAKKNLRFYQCKFQQFRSMMRDFVCRRYIFLRTNKTVNQLNKRNTANPSCKQKPAYALSKIK